jgi:hypothetical protein
MQMERTVFCIRAMLRDIENFYWHLILTHDTRLQSKMKHLSLICFQLSLLRLNILIILLAL